jgi:two-component system sensor histidine kinase KdpD
VIGVGRAVRAVPWRRWLAAALALALATVLLLLVRPSLDKVHVALAYLLVVLGGSAAGGRSLGIALSFGAFFVFNFYFLAPHHTLTIAEPRDWLVLVAFLVTGIVAAQLLYRAQEEAQQARDRAGEVDRLAALGAETLSVGRADEALAAIVRMIRVTLDIERCDVIAWERGASSALVASSHADGRATTERRETHELPELVRWVGEHGSEAAELADGTTRLVEPRGRVNAAVAPDVRLRFIPLSVRERTVGILRLEDVGSMALDATRQRYLDALAYYAALGVERVRLAGEAERVEALREADRLKDSLLATVSHDMRTPLTTIRGLAHAIAQEGDDRALVIEEEVERLNRFVADLLDLSRLHAGGVPTSVALNAAEDVMGAALQRVAGLADRHELRATLDPSAPVLVGRFDFAQTLRILVNLLENAFKYAPAGTTVDFAVRRVEGWLAFSVADRGPGVAEAERERIFAPFYRPPGAPPDVGGAGLGLAIAKGLAEAQGGAIDCAPRTGGGSVFTLRLPAADLDDALLRPAADAIRSS